MQAILRGSSIKISTKALREEKALCGGEVPGDVPEKLREARVREHRSVTSRPGAYSSSNAPV